VPILTIKKIVPRESARLGIPGDRENVVKLNADHRGVCKFGPSETDQDNLKLVCSNIKDLFQSALKTGKSLSLPSVIDEGRTTPRNVYRSDGLENEKIVR
jgi:hypothetical protein